MEQFIQTFKIRICNALILEKEPMLKLMIKDSFQKYDLEIPYTNDYSINKVFIENFLQRLINDKEMLKYFYEEYNDFLRHTSN